jgi:hypothetical protein
MTTSTRDHKTLAHGFNEELTIILNTAQYTLRLVGPEHPASAILLDLKGAALRCTALAKSLLH